MKKLKTERLNVRLSEEEKDKLLKTCKKFKCTQTQFFLSKIDEEVDDDCVTFRFPTENVYEKLGFGINQIARIANTEKRISNDLLQRQNNLMKELIKVSNEQRNLAREALIFLENFKINEKEK